MKHQPAFFRRIAAGLAILLPLLLAAIACNFQARQDDTALRQTDIALGLQQTQLAQTADALVVESYKPTQPLAATRAAAATPTVSAGLAPVVGRQTDTPAAAAPITAVPVVDTPTPAATPGPEAIEIADWKLFQFVKQTDDCRGGSEVCWSIHMSGSGAWKSGKPVEGTLSSSQTFLVDPAWPNPYLIYAHRPSKLQNFSAYLQIASREGEWRTVKAYEVSSNAWLSEAINLNIFKGQQIRIRFYGLLTNYVTRASSTMYLEWYIDDVKIVPNY